LANEDDMRSESVDSFRADQNPLGTRGEVLVSVVIPAYNCAQYIAQTLESILTQTFSHYEIVVVNDGSPDTASLETAVAPYRTRIRYLAQETRGPGGARNTGIVEARGKYVAFLDADDFWDPHHLAKQMALLSRDLSLELVYSDSILLKDEKPVARAFQMEPQRGAVTFESLLTEDCAISTSSTVVSREAILRNGLFDESFLRCEDFDMWLRMAFQGTRIGYHRDATVFHRLLGRGLSADRWAMKRARIRVYEKMTATLSLSGSQLEMIRKLIAKTEAECQIELLKGFLETGEFSKAMDAVKLARREKDSWKLKSVSLGLRLGPRLFRLLHRSWRKLIYHSEHGQIGALTVPGLNHGDREHADEGSASLEVATHGAPNKTSKGLTR
jgi:glycosyltransferase involved in cell wall biosynthesis